MVATIRMRVAAEPLPKHAAIVEIDDGSLIFDRHGDRYLCGGCSTSLR